MKNLKLCFLLIFRTFGIDLDSYIQEVVKILYLYDFVFDACNFVEPSVLRISSPIGVSPNEGSRMFRPLDNVSLGRRVPWAMRPLDDASLNEMSLKIGHG